MTSECFTMTTVCDYCGTEYPSSASACPFECDDLDLPEYDLCECCGTEYPAGESCPSWCASGECLGIHDLDDVSHPSLIVRIRLIFSPRQWQIRRWLDYPRHRVWLFKYKRAIDRSHRHPLDDLPF